MNPNHHCQVLSFANQKGGVGKSTLLLQMAHYLRLTKPECRILVIDFDPQGNTSTRLAQQGDFESNEALLLFAEDHKPQPVQTSFGLDLIGTTPNNAAFYEVEELSLDHALFPKNNLQPLMSDYDMILLDCPPSLGKKFYAALSMSTHIICPVQLSGFALDGISGVLSTVDMVRQTSNPQLEVVGVLINAMNSRSKSHATALSEFQAAAPDLLLPTIIHNRAAIDEATTLGQPIHVVARNTDKAITEIHDAMQLILNRMQGLPS